MTSLRRALLLLGILGFVAGAVPLALALANEDGHQRELIAVFGPLTGWAFVGTGIYAWLRRPESRFGALMTAVGFSACLAALRVSEEPWIFVTGLLFITSQWALLYHMLLTFPSGTLSGRTDRLLVAGMYVNSLVLHPIQVAFQDTTQGGFPENPLLIDANREASVTLSEVRFWFAIALIAALGVILVRRFAAASSAQRRVLAPVLVSGGAVMALLGVWYAMMLAHVDPDVVQAVEDARYVALAVVPFAFLAGVLQSRVAGATAVSEVVARLGDTTAGPVCEALGEALRHTPLELALRTPEGGYIDPDGRPVKLPPEGSRRVVTPVEQDGEAFAYIIHDAALGDQRNLVRAVAAATGMALENERLGAELRAKIDELSASRRRIVESGDAARRRLERDLHDGAQQRLVSLALSLRMLRQQVGDDPEALTELETARIELEHALEELRELARGIHPSVLSDRGLPAALDGLAHRAPIPVELEATPEERLPERVESAAYFVVAEALTNVAKYARATYASVNVSRYNGHVCVEVADDGVGGADPQAGTGLAGLVDRVAALGGELEVDSPPGRGTKVRAEIPCE